MSQTFTLNGPMLPPKSGVAPKQLVIFAHGVGANGQDLIGLAPFFQEVLPDAAFISPNAPEDFAFAPPGSGAYQWFTLQDFSYQERLEGVQSAGPILDKFLDEVQSAYGLDDSKTALVGFSQGTMVSLYVGLRRAKPLAGILGYSGMLIAGETLDAEITARPPVRLIHGVEDPVLPYASLAEAYEGLKAVNVPVEQFSRPGLGHGIDQEGINLGIDFLATCFS